MLVEFSLNFVYSITCGKNVQVYGVHSPRKHIESRHFYLCPPSPIKTLPQVLTISQKFSSHPQQKEITRCLQEAFFFFKNLFPKQQKGKEESMICIIRIQSENMKMSGNIRLFAFCLIVNFIKCDAFTFS